MFCILGPSFSGFLCPGIHFLTKMLGKAFVSTITHHLTNFRYDRDVMRPEGES
jgi:hypothetical protein